MGNDACFEPRILRMRRQEKTYIAECKFLDHFIFERSRIVLPAIMNSPRPR